MTAINFAISGAMGRMGQMITDVAKSSGDMVLCGGLEYSASPHQGSPCGTGVITDDATNLAQAKVIIDFSRPEATMALIGRKNQHLRHWSSTQLALMMHKKQRFVRRQRLFLFYIVPTHLWG